MKHVIIGVDVGNATTEAAVAAISETGIPDFIGSAMAQTTGTKGTVDNIEGIGAVIDRLLKQEKEIVIDKILLNDAAPVIADFAMETITETIITDSAMIGHNPDTPGGQGLGAGQTVKLGAKLELGKKYIIVIDEDVNFEDAAGWINNQCRQGFQIAGAIVKKDEGTLIHNRLDKPIPIVDEVQRIEDVPLNMPGAVEVAPLGRSIDLLSNPYGIATVFHLTAEETDYCRRIAKALIGNSSAVIVKTPASEIKARMIPAGELEIVGERYSTKVPVDSGAQKIMSIAGDYKTILDVRGEPGTNIGGMLESVKMNMARSCERRKEEICISDIFAVDSYTAVPVKGGLAGEVAMESGVALAAMVRIDKTFMAKVAAALEKKTGVPVEIGGVEAEMALKGVLTTPGTKAPVIMVDIGAGSTDVAYLDQGGNHKIIHLAGAGNLITMLIQSELCLNSFEEAETVKKFPLAIIDNLYRIRYENGDVAFLKEPLPPKYFGHVVAVSEDLRLQIVDTGQTMEKIRNVRRQAKHEVIVQNIRRALKAIGIDDHSRKKLVLVGGTVLDFELANMITDDMEKMKITAGKGNIRGCEGPRNAVATGLICKYCEKNYGKQ